jgi:ABC-2 type transport system permease protein
MAFLRRDLGLNLSYRVSFLLQFATIVFSVATFYFVAQVFGGAIIPELAVYGGDYFSFVLIGLAFNTYMGLALRDFASNIREGQVMGTLEIMLLSPTGLSAILLSSALWDYLLASLRVFLYLLLGALVFGANLGQANVLSAILVLLLSMVSFASLGILSAAFVLVLKKGDPVAWVFTSLSTLLAGVYYPVSVLPDALERLSSVVPLTYALRAMRLAILQGYSPQELGGELLILVVFAAVLLPLSTWAFRQATRRAKKEGSLAEY